MGAQKYPRTHSHYSLNILCEYEWASQCEEEYI